MNSTLCKSCASPACESPATRNTTARILHPLITTPSSYSAPPLPLGGRLRQPPRSLHYSSATPAWQFRLFPRMFFIPCLFRTYKHPCALSFVGAVHRYVIARVAKQSPPPGIEIASSLRSSQGHSLAGSRFSCQRDTHAPQNVVAHKHPCRLFSDLFIIYLIAGHDIRRRGDESRATSDAPPSDEQEVRP